MNWALAGLIYAGAYVAVVLALGDREHARLIVGNVGLLLPPLAPIAVMLSRRGQWQGRQAVFWATIGAWPVLWLIGQIGWFVDEVFRSMPLPWFKWHIILQLSGSALPLIALVAWPHRGKQGESAVTVAVDIVVLEFLTAFLYWSLIIAPGMDPPHSAEALHALATIGPSVRLAALAGLLFAMWKAEGSRWAMVYQRLALGMMLAFVVLVGLSMATVNGDYQTGSASDIGWMLPFWFAAWAMATAPASEHESVRAIQPASTARPSPAVLFAAILTVPVIGYGARYLVPAAEPIERMREIATAATMVCGVALVMVRLVVERRSVEQADQRVRLLATASEQAGELIVITREGRFVYANEAFCQATGYSREEILTIPPINLVAPESKDDLPPLRERLRKRQIVRATTVMARKDGSTFQAAWSAAPIVDHTGHITEIVGVVRDVTDDLRLREQLVRSERMSAIGELVSGVAHEINNPNHFIMLNAPLLKSAWNDLRPIVDEHVQSHGPLRVANLPWEEMRTEIPEVIDEIGAGAERIRAIVSELRTFGRDQDPGQHKPTSVNAVVAGSLP